MPVWLFKISLISVLSFSILNFVYLLFFFIHELKFLENCILDYIFSQDFFYLFIYLCFHLTQMFKLSLYEDHYIRH